MPLPYLLCGALKFAEVPRISPKDSSGRPRTREGSGNTCWQTRFSTPRRLKRKTYGFPGKIFLGPVSLGGEPPPQNPPTLCWCGVGGDSETIRGIDSKVQIICRAGLNLNRAAGMNGGRISEMKGLQDSSDRGIKPTGHYARV